MWQRAFVNDIVILSKLAKPVDGRTSNQVGIKALHLGRYFYGNGPKIGKWISMFRNVQKVRTMHIVIIHSIDE